MALRHFKLNNGLLFPSVVLGTWQGFTQEERDATFDVVKDAVKAGYRHIDGASVYGNQKQIGAGLRECFETGLVKREEMWITSKLWCNDHSRVAEALQMTLNDLQLDYLDLYLVHWPVRMKAECGNFDFKAECFEPMEFKQLWEDMEKLVESKKVRAIGVSNFSAKKLDELLAHAKITPAVNQVECRPGWQQKKLHEYCASKGIHLSAYSPLGKRKDIDNPVVQEVSAKVGKSPAQVVLRWGLQSGHSVLPKSANPDRLKENLDLFDWSIPEAEFQKLSNVEQSRMNEFCNDISVFKPLQELWDEE